jgi:hypothetical protein
VNKIEGRIATMSRTNGSETPRHAEKTSTGLATAFAASLLLAIALPGTAAAQLTSEVTAGGTAGGQAVESDTVTETTDLEAPRPALSASQSIDLDVSKGRDSENADAGDIVSVTVSVSNEGNFPVQTVIVDGATLTIAGNAIQLEPASFSPSSADIATGESATFTTTYALTSADVYGAAAGDGISVRSGAMGKSAEQSVSARAEPGNIVVAANPKLAISSSSDMEKAEGNEGEGAETGDRITYKYRVENVGNVAVADVGVTVKLSGKTLTSAGSPADGIDPFAVEVASEDALAVNSDLPETQGVYDNLGPGGAVVFTHVHTVTQAEFEAQ